MKITGFTCVMGSKLKDKANVGHGIEIFENGMREFAV